MRKTCSYLMSSSSNKFYFEQRKLSVIRNRYRLVFCYRTFCTAGFFVSDSYYILVAVFFKHNLNFTVLGVQNTVNNGNAYTKQITANNKDNSTRPVPIGCRFSATRIIVAPPVFWWRIIARKRSFKKGYESI